MLSSNYLLALLPLIARAYAAGVTGAAQGFAKGVTGGGSATPVYPADIAELISYLTDDSPRVIMLNKEYNFIGSEGSVTATGCRPASNTCPGNGGQDAINQANWCTNGNAGTGATSISVTYDKAGIEGINVASDKSIIGVGSAGVMRGKGLRIANGATNVIIQNIFITELNPQYIWGGDAITLDGTDLVWIDHCKISLTGRQFIVLGNSASNRVTISHNELDGSTSWSATCDNHHYWAILLDGSSDLVTLQDNYIHHTSGRSPKVAENNLVHALNNYWYANSGHAFDIDAGNNVVAEGNVFQSVVTPLLASSAGNLFASPDTTTNKECTSYLGHACLVNVLTSSGSFVGTSENALVNFTGKSIATPVAANAASIKAGAGIGLL